MSKLDKWKREEGRMWHKFTPHSFQYKHFREHGRHGNLTIKHKLGQRCLCKQGRTEE
jgi:hypothetical protein